MKIAVSAQGKDLHAAVDARFGRGAMFYCCGHGNR